MFNKALLLSSGGESPYTHKIYCGKFGVGSGYVYGAYNAPTNIEPNTFEGVRIRHLCSAHTSGDHSDMIMFDQGVSVGNSIKITRMDTGLEAIYTFAGTAYYSPTQFITESDHGNFIYLKMELV